MIAFCRLVLSDFCTNVPTFGDGRSSLSPGADTGGDDGLSSSDQALNSFELFVSRLAVHDCYQSTSYQFGRRFYTRSAEFGMRRESFLHWPFFVGCAKLAVGM